MAKMIWRVPEDSSNSIPILRKLLWWVGRRNRKREQGDGDGEGGERKKEAKKERQKERKQKSDESRFEN